MLCWDKNHNLSLKLCTHKKRKYRRRKKAKNEKMSVIWRTIGIWWHTSSTATTTSKFYIHIFRLKIGSGFCYFYQPRRQMTLIKNIAIRNILFRHRLIVVVPYHMLHKTHCWQKFCFELSLKCNFWIFRSLKNKHGGSDIADIGNIYKSEALAETLESFF